MPRRDRRYTLDEETLAERIKHPTAIEIGPRVLHDVDCVAGVLIIRADTTAQTWEDARAVFTTTSGLLVKNANEWFAQSGVQGLPPTIHVLALSNIAWLKKPAGAQKLKLRELVAVCEAALRPSRQTWSQFLTQLRRLEEDGRVTSEESVAILASELTDKLLSNLEEEEEHLEAASVGEIVERVKQTYKEAADARAAIAEAETARVTEHHRRVVIRLTSKADGLARFVSYTVFVLTSAVVGYGLLLSIPGMIAAARPGSRAALIARVAGAAVYIVSFFSLLAGHHLARWRLSLQTRLSPIFRKWALGDAADGLGTAAAKSTGRLGSPDRLP